MIWAVVSALVISFALNVLLSVLVWRAFSTSTIVLDESHKRTTEYTKDLLDRLMVKDWPDYQSTQWEPVEAIDQEAVTEVFVPTPGPDRGGFGSRLGLSAYHAPDEEIKPEEELP